MLCGREGCSRETRVMNKVAPRVFSLTCPLVCSAGRGGSAAPVSLVRMPPYRGFIGHSPDGAVASPPRLCMYVAGTSHCTRPYLYQWSGAGSPAHAYSSDGRLLRKGYPPSDPRSAATNERDEAMGTPACALKGGIQPNRGARTVAKRSHGVYPSHSRHLLTRLPSSPGPPPRLPSNCARTPAPVASPPCVPVAAARPHRAVTGTHRTARGRGRRLWGGPRRAVAPPRPVVSSARKDPADGQPPPVGSGRC